MKSSLPLLFCFIIAKYVGAQVNLVPNGSFEEYVHCPDNSNEADSCIGWRRIKYSPDYFNTCAPYPVCIPDNSAGYQTAQFGNAYMGLLTYTYFAGSYTLWREVIGTDLIQPMIPGNEYSVSMRVSRGNWTPMAYNCAASNKLGMRFSTQAYSFSNSFTSPPAIDNFAQAYVDSIVTDTINWVLLHWNYIADSAYTHLYIGNFFDDSHTDTMVINAPLGQVGDAYYFIDSVNVICEGDDCISGMSDAEITPVNIWYDVSHREIQIVGLKKNVGVIVINTNGQVVHKRNAIGDVSLNAKNWTNGIYIIQLKTEQYALVKKILVK